jgi:choline dehydrogenase-like flavoprotein
MDEELGRRILGTPVSGRLSSVAWACHGSHLRSKFEGTARETRLAMFVDANALPDKSVVDTDVCIVGAGPAGIALAHEMLGQQFRVCIVESGGSTFEPETQELARLATVESNIVPAYQYRRRQLGGNTNVWYVGRRPKRSLVRYLPLDEIDFAQRPWVPYSGWPFGRSELDPYYERAHRLLGLGAYSYSVADGARPSAHTLPLDTELVRTSVEWFGTSKPFVEYLSELRRSTNVTTLFHATVGALESQEAGGRIERARIACLNGTNHTLTAAVFVLATGGIENPRLLLMSNDRRPAGIGNEHDLVGRFFMDHLHVRGALVPADRRLFETSALYDVRTIADGRVMGCKLNLTDGVMEREELLNSALKLEARFPTRPLPKFVDTYARLMVKHRQLRPSFFGWSTLPNKARRFADFSTHLQIELAPEPNNRVTLAAERDRLGRPLAAVQWKWDALSRRTVQRARDILSESIARAGLGVLEMSHEDPPPLAHRDGINHHTGTTRMHNDPKQGVVDRNCRVHGISNLFIAGSSVFPTGGYANPTLTIVAMAIRLADHLRMFMNSAARAI